MSTLQTIKEIERHHWFVKQCAETKDYQAFFRGFKTPWRKTLLEVLADVTGEKIPSAETKP